MLLPGFGLAIGLPRAMDLARRMKNPDLVSGVGPHDPSASVAVPFCFRWLPSSQPGIQRAARPPVRIRRIPAGSARKRGQPGER